MDTPLTQEKTLAAIRDVTLCLDECGCSMDQQALHHISGWPAAQFKDVLELMMLTRLIEPSGISGLTLTEKGRKLADECKVYAVKRLQNEYLK